LLCAEITECGDRGVQLASSLRSSEGAEPAGVCIHEILGSSKCVEPALLVLPHGV
jgi:hypothetical protein